MLVTESERQASVKDRKGIRADPQSVIMEKWRRTRRKPYSTMRANFLLQSVPIGDRFTSRRNSSRTRYAAQLQVLLAQALVMITIRVDFFALT